MKRKNAERFYGRRGGGWANDGDVGDRDRAGDFAAMRLTHVRAGDWPEHSLAMWAERAAGGDPAAVAVMEADADARAHARGRYAPARRAS